MRRREVFAMRRLFALLIVTVAAVGDVAGAAVDRVACGGVAPADDGCVRQFTLDADEFSLEVGFSGVFPLGFNGALRATVSTATGTLTADCESASIVFTAATCGYDQTGYWGQDQAATLTVTVAGVGHWEVVATG